MTTLDESLIHAALAPARRVEPTDAEVIQVVSRAGHPPSRRVPRGRRSLALALIGVLLAATGAGAATGLLPIGSLLEGDGFTNGASDVDETVVASGVAPKSGRWQMTAFESEQGAECLKLELLDVAAGSRDGPRSSGYCGYIATTGALGHGTAEAGERRGEVILFGRAPDQARSVQLTGSNGVEVTMSTQTATAGMPGTYWLIAAPRGVEDARVRFLGADDRPQGDPIDVSYRFSGRIEPAIAMSGTAPFVGPWTLKVYESQRSVVDGDLYQPEGLPCQTVFLDQPRPDTAGGSGGCGFQPRSPGFTLHQLSAPATVGSTPKEVLSFGMSPESADVVEIVSPDGDVVRSVPVEPGPKDGPDSTYWLIVTGPDVLRDATVRWVDRDTGERGPELTIDRS